jgi:phosphoribosylanthranilate isomerase
MIAAAEAGSHALLVAPTGGGKTLAGFLPTLIELAERGPRPGVAARGIGAVRGGHRRGGGVVVAVMLRVVTHRLAIRARGRADIIAVTVDADDELLALIARTLQPDWIQLHGAEAPARVAAARRLANKGAIRAMGVARAADLAAIDASYAGRAPITTDYVRGAGRHGRRRR